MEYLAVIVLAILAITVIFSWALDTHRFIVRHYEIRSDKIRKNIRLVFITDLHNKEYEKGNSRLIDAVDAQSPDAVIIGGDLLNGVEDGDFTPAVELVRNLALRYPVYYGMGNHEYRLKIYPERFDDIWKSYTDAISKSGVRILDNERLALDDYGLDIAALSIDRRYYKKLHRYRLDPDEITDLLGQPSKDKLQLLLAHNPDYFKSYAQWGADLTLSGHLHGGIMRLPLLGGVISPKLTLFPRYSGGEYSLGKHTLIVSCGLGMHTVNIRIFNPGELAVVDIVKE